MALVTRTDGSGGSNQIASAWFNDFKNLLTGVMTDQAVRITNSITSQVATANPSVAPSEATAVGTSLGIGLYTYAYTWVNSSGGETAPSPTSTVTTTTGNRNVSVTAIAVGPTGTGSRRLYRTTVGGADLQLVTTIADNTTTTFTDTVVDGSLGAYAPNYSSYGGSFLLKDNSGNLHGFVQQDSSNSGTVSVTSTGRTEFNFTTIAPGLTAPFYVDINGPHVFGNGLYVKETNGATASLVTVGNAGIGIKMANGTRIMEVSSGGNMIILGSQYRTTAGTVSTVAGSSFSSFDVAEIYECDQPYEQGTVVCPGPNNKMTLCTHDNCFAASVISHLPGLMLGGEDDDKGHQSVALAGRVQVRTSTPHIGYRILVVSDGKGGVRPIYPDEKAYTLGFTLNTPVNGMVGIMLRPMYCVKE
jgi:hypothetical protein